MSNPFDDADKSFLVLINSEGQYSLWPDFIAVPAGWTTVASGNKEECLHYVNTHWVDMRPKSLIDVMGK